MCQMKDSPDNNETKTQVISRVGKKALRVTTSDAGSGTVQGSSGQVATQPQVRITSGDNTGIHSLRKKRGDRDPFQAYPSEHAVFSGVMRAGKVSCESRAAATHQRRQI